MSESKIHARLPALPSPDWFRDPEHSIMTADGAALLSYDPVTRSGFVYSLGSDVWQISAPVDFITFALHVRYAGYTIGNGEDVQRWLRACSQNPDGGNVVDFTARTRH